MPSIIERIRRIIRRPSDGGTGGGGGGGRGGSPPSSSPAPRTPQYTPAPTPDPRPYTPVDPGQQFSPAPSPTPPYSGGSGRSGGGSSGGGSSRAPTYTPVDPGKQFSPLPEQDKTPEFGSNVPVSSGRITVVQQLKRQPIKKPTPLQQVQQERREFSRGTQFDQQVPKDIPVYTQPTFIQRQIGEVTDTSTGAKVPLVQTYYFDSLGQSLGGGAYRSTERVATAEEQKKFQQLIKPEEDLTRIGTEKRTKVDLIKSKIRKGKQSYQQAEFQLSKNLEGYGISDEKIEGISDRFKVPAVIGFIPGVNKFVGGAVEGVAKNVKQKPLASAATLGVGFGAGTAKSLILRGASKAGTKVGGVTKLGITGAEVLVGGAYAVDVTARTTAKGLTPEQRGEVFGVGVKDAVLFGIGYAKGGKAVTQVRGILATRGRQEVPLEGLTTKEIITGKDKFLLIPKEKQLSAFKEGRYAKAIKETPGGFHTTPQRFAIKDPLAPKAGTSEIPGLYIAPGISPAFSKIPGSGSGFNIPSLKELVSPEVKPGVAFLKPEEFRVTGFRKVKPYKIEEQSFRFKLRGKPKKGAADLPLQKGEAEAILRPESGQYVFESGKYFTTIEGVRVPIDVFKFDVKTARRIKVGKEKLPKTLEESGRYELPKRSRSSPRSYTRASSSSLIGSRASSVISRVSSTTSSSVSRLSRSSLSSLPSSYVSKGYSGLSRSSISSISRAYSSRSYGGSSIIYSSSIPTIPQFKKTILKAKSKRPPQRKPQPTRYQPSFTALGLNIRKKKAGKFAGALSLRPILDDKPNKNKALNIFGF